MKLASMADRMRQRAAKTAPDVVSAEPVPSAPTADVPQGKRRKWTDEDYRLRGLKLPNPELMSWGLQVLPAVKARARELALAEGCSVSELVAKLVLAQ